jgi:hypothetical protein
MVEKAHTELDQMLRHLMLIGFGALLGWTAATAYGVASASWDIDTNGALRFLLAILIVTFAHRTVDEVREWRMSTRRSTDERSGFAEPVWETPRSMETTMQGTEAVETVEAAVTEAPQPPQ